MLVYNIKSSQIELPNKKGSGMGALLKLLGIREMPYQSLVKAPSADLIRSDNELIMPELEDINCSMTINEINTYIDLAKSTEEYYTNRHIWGLWMLNRLRQHGFQCYNFTAVVNFMIRQVQYLSRVHNSRIDWEWNRLSECGPLPPRILRKIAKLTSEDYKAKLRFLTVEINCSSVKNLKGVCFLAVDTVDTNGSGRSELVSIIDAWRGPTFSDEEAKI